MTANSNKAINDRSQASTATAQLPETQPIFTKASQLSSLKIKSGIRAGKSREEKSK